MHHSVKAISERDHLLSPAHEELPCCYEFTTLVMGCRVRYLQGGARYACTYPCRKLVLGLHNKCGAHNIQAIFKQVP